MPPTNLESDLVKLFTRSVGAAFPGENFIWKFHASEYDPSGIPDIIGSIRGQFFGAELKMEGNYFSPVQKAKMKMLHDTGALVVGIYYMKREDTYWLIPCDVVQNFSLKDRTGWLPLPKKITHTDSGVPVLVLNLNALKVLSLKEY